MGLKLSGAGFNPFDQLFRSPSRQDILELRTVVLDQADILDQHVIHDPLSVLQHHPVRHRNGLAVGQGDDGLDLGAITLCREDFTGIFDLFPVVSLNFVKVGYEQEIRKGLVEPFFLGIGKTRPISAHRARGEFTEIKNFMNIFLDLSTERNPLNRIFIIGFLQHIQNLIDLRLQNRERRFRGMDGTAKDNTDLECGRQQMDFQDRLQEEVQLAYESGELDAACFDKEGRLVPGQKTDDFIKKIQAQKIEYLRMRGPSKEHRFDLPLTSIALVINEEGIPIDFYVYAGNASEFKTMAASIESLKQKYNVKESIVVADRGLNSAANLKMLQSNDLGFLMAQKVSNLDQKTTKAMFDPEGYVPIIRQGEEVARFKVVKDWIKKGKRKAEDTKCTLVLTFDKKRQKRDLAVLEVWKQLVLKKQAQGIKVKPKTSGWASIAKTSEKTEARIEGIDEETFEAKRRLAGYAALVYKNAPNCQEKDAVPDGRLAAAYHELNQIESCFRIMKSHLGLRPMYVRNSNHIKGHILICVIALGILKLLQWKLNKSGTPLTISEIIRALNSATTVPIKSGDELMFLQCSRPQNIRKGLERLSQEELKAELAKRRKQPNQLEILFKTVGLVPPARLVNLKEMGRCLGVRLTTEEAIPELIKDML